MPQITEAVAEARSHGDLRENAAYDAARHDQMMMKRRIDELEQLLRNAEIIDDSASESGVVGLGSTVVVDFDGDEETYTIVGRDRGAAGPRHDLQRVPDRAGADRQARRSKSHVRDSGVVRTEVTILRVE